MILKNSGSMHKKNIIRAGKELSESGKALIMLHGRGGSAEDILSIAEYLNVKEYALLAPEATGNTWYPYSFLAQPSANEPWLSSAMQLLSDVVNDVQEHGITSDNIFFLGFSQGACLTLEFIARHAAKYGGVVAFTGGLIGDKIYRKNYKGDFEATPVFIGSSDPDPHIPVERVYATANIFRSMNASVTEKVYSNMGHTINEDEIKNANNMVFNL